MPFFFGNELDGSDAIAAVHLIHVFDGTQGRVVVMTYAEQGVPETWECDPPPPGGAAGGRIYLWTPPPPNSPANAGSFQSIPNNCHNYLLCTGHSALADGRILVAGSEYAYFNNIHKQADLFNPSSPIGLQWNLPLTPPNMEDSRWYPTCTTLPNGKVLVTSGSYGNGSGPNPPQTAVIFPELYDPTTNTWDLLESAERAQELYPYMFVLPDGNLVDAGPSAWSYTLKSSTWTWGGFIDIPAFPPNTPHPSKDGSAVMYEPGKIMRCGGADSSTDPAVTTTWVMDLNGADPDQAIVANWLNADPMNHGRLHDNLVILPDGKVLALGGTQMGHTIPVFVAEIFDPVSGTWSVQPGSDPTQEREYHSTAMLLPDGRVISAGGDGFPTAQIFNPPYLIGTPPNNPPPPRPIITSAPAYMQYGQEYMVLYDDNHGPPVSKVCLIRLASVTHGFDHDQRRVPLTIVTDPEIGVEDGIGVAAPANANIAPQGYYMLFILNEYAKNKFAPCTMAAYVKIGP